MASAVDPFYSHIPRVLVAVSMDSAVDLFYLAVAPRVLVVVQMASAADLFYRPIVPRVLVVVLYIV
jgi:hypothetical protein